jgi:UDP-N-acetylmuramoylalanine-D-glutamate ligase
MNVVVEVEDNNSCLLVLWFNISPGHLDYHSSILNKKKDNWDWSYACNQLINKQNKYKTKYRKKKFRQKSSATPGAVEISDKTNSFKNHF